MGGHLLSAGASRLLEAVWGSCSLSVLTSTPLVLGVFVPADSY